MRPFGPAAHTARLDFPLSAWKAPGSNIFHAAPVPRSDPEVPVASQALMSASHRTAERNPAGPAGGAVHVLPRFAVMAMFCCGSLSFA